jgi:two-component system phosphate regulon sensor histidine kinase PhoR
MRSTSRRALIWVLSIAAVLAPAGGIAYLGAVSYRDERGAVAARLATQRDAAIRLAATVEARIGRALDPAVTDEPLAADRFRLDAEGRLLAPLADPLGGVEPPDPAQVRSEGCTARGLESCIRELRSEERRAAQLDAARRAELAGRRAEARRGYEALTGFDDTGAAALFGLARLARQDGAPAIATARLREIGRRFGHRREDGVPLALVAALGVANLAPDASAALATYGELLDRRYAGPPAALTAAVERLRALAATRATPAERPLLASLDRRYAAALADAGRAAALGPDAIDLARAASTTARGRPATVDPARTLVVRRADDGAIAGVVVDGGGLAAAALAPDALAQIAPRARPLVLPTGAPPPPDVRVLATVPLGAALPHLTLTIVNDPTDPDPLDDVIRNRSRRHVGLTVGLAAVLALGLLATIRGAARERELARLKSDFVSTVSHELKTPLTSIRMFAEMLEQGVAQGDADRTARYHGIIVQESQRLGLLIANLLDYAQIERGTRRYRLARAPVAEIARDAVATFRGLREAQPSNEVVVEVSPEAAHLTALVDRDVMIQALLNLLANAAKYGGADAPIRVVVDRTGHEARLTVVDRGPGIPAAEHERIFREFYRTPQAYSAGVEGTGLGLALVRNHVTAHGGRVTVESAPGKGAAFTIALPALDGAANGAA